MTTFVKIHLKFHFSFIPKIGFIALLILLNCTWGNPVVLKDATGYVHTFQKTPKRIVSLIPSSTEMLYALGLEDKIVGVSVNDNFPPSIQNLPKVAGMKVNVEKLIQLKPDIIVGVTSLNKGIVSDLRKLGFVVFLQNTQSLQGVRNDIQDLGYIFRKSSVADSIIHNLKLREERIRFRVQKIPLAQRPKVFIEHYPGLYTAGTGTFMHELITVAGGKNIASHIQGWGRLSEEIILVQNPDVILYTSGNANNQGTILRDLIESRNHWKNLTAFKNKCIYGIHQDIISRPGPRLIQGLEKIYQMLHFNNKDSGSYDE